MPIASSDIVFRLSGGAGNTDPNLSLGGAISSTALVDATLHNLFDAVSGDESSAGDVEFRCVYCRNSHATLTMQAARVYISSQSSSADTSIDIGLGTSAINGVEQTVANESTAPAGVTFSAPAAEGAALTIGDIPPGEHRSLWIRRTVAAGAAAFDNDSASIRVRCDSAA